LSEVINWFNRGRDKYVIFGASVFDGDLDTWAKKDTLEELVDMVTDSWEIHFEKDNMPNNGGHFAFFQEVDKPETQWLIEEWDGEDSEAFLGDLERLIRQFWHKPWTCGFGHLTSQNAYEVNWRRYNV
jgi:hypothetical protein|tara:strand:+ start:5639 stop:6022 length:384 start_codon:yes stop_codon:yes gene_type:complete